ncbi:flagellar assembly peptidoglycan hydrolase FlgJ [Chromatium okenii]|uniref:flagellar assembly peptidoglycan hydrolase FlgJ n=1 Tax=Chromatium okenii TaxID=61644 RepID=UPI001907F85E|nr:flagellar assembly peptidoglycan hydrolase FlgJ [Chromatium okenii]MBK1641067.1 flagellar assembly peptidoglycan hydrolase FlgJ [Chromatium okenii]
MTSAAAPTGASGGLVSDPKSLQPLATSARNGDPAALEATARAFEGLLTGQMLKQMRAASSGGGIFDSEQSKMYQELHDQQIAAALSQGEGLGLRKLLMRQLSPTGVSAGATTVSGERDPKTLRLPERNQALKPLHRQSVDAAAPAAAPTTASVSSNQVKPLTTFQGQAQWPPRTPAEFVAYLKPFAQQAAQTLGMDTDVLLAQSALETGWGKHIPRRADGSSSFNLFGIKADSRWEGASVAVGTLEYRNGVAQRERAKFRAYESPADAFVDYVAFLRRNPRYGKALASTNGADFIRGLQQAGYATDPRYAAKVLGIRDRFGSLSASEVVATSQVSSVRADKTTES